MIRPATHADAESLAVHRYPDVHDALERPLYAAWVADAVQRGRYLGFVRELNGEIIAGAGLTILEWGPTRRDPQAFRARLVNVWTHPDYRRLGYARELVQLCLSAALERGISRLSLGTTAAARPLYEGLGLRVSSKEMTLNLAEHPGHFPKTP